MNKHENLGDAKTRATEKLGESGTSSTNKGIDNDGTIRGKQDMRRDDKRDAPVAAAKPAMRLVFPTPGLPSSRTAL